MLLKYCALVVLSVRGKHCRLEDEIVIQALIRITNKQGQIYMDKGNLLTQEEPQTDLCIDEVSGAVTIKKAMSTNTYDRS